MKNENCTFLASKACFEKGLLFSLTLARFSEGFFLRRVGLFKLGLLSAFVSVSLIGFLKLGSTNSTIISISLGLSTDARGNFVGNAGTSVQQELINGSLAG